MSLESLLKPVKWLDQKVQKQYTKLGKRIPEQHLYKVTTGLHLFGYLGADVFGSPEQFNQWPFIYRGIYGGICGATDLVLNFYGLGGDPPTFVSDNAQIINPKHEFKLNLTRVIRLPILTTGLSILGYVVCNLASLIINGESLSPDTHLQATGGLGLVSMASSMYLKDQDPKLLDKQPSRIKEVLGTIYDKAKELLPVPTPNTAPRILA